jgi:HD-GYP domain-containing protein (c-di-GMP phosphodiesterase class II)
MPTHLAQFITRLQTHLDKAGVVFWLFEGNRQIVATTQPGSALWTSERAASAARTAASSTREIAPGVWACSLTLGEPCRGMKLVLAACGSGLIASSLCTGSGRRINISELSAYTRFSAESAPRILSMAQVWAADACMLMDHEHTIAGFTTQLSQSFDNIDCLYSLGRAMRDPTKPREFLRFVCERLRLSTDFAWVAARFTGDDDAAATLTDRFYLSGSPGAEVSKLVRVSGELVSEHNSKQGVQVLPAIPAISTGSHQQVLLHPIQEGVGPAGALIAGEKRGLDSTVSSWDIQLFEAAAGFITSYLDNVALFEEQKKLFLGTVQALTAAIDAKDRYTRGHSERVAHLSGLLAREIGMSDEQVEDVRIAGLVHDVGKIGVPEAVLTKQGRLTEVEYDAIKRHPQIGYGILRDIRPLENVLPGVLHHHERWDGKGYPSGLSNEQIPLQARIIAIADTFDAMSSTRSYRPAMARDKVLAELRACAGSQFDPDMVPSFMRVDLSQFDLLVAKHAAAESAPASSAEVPPAQAA